ncbi:MAG: LptF/LptG family permease [Anaerovibrio sp.]|uniref:LptF/LptG family permease n=1 Tax=Anaerovibrio sp. TaxID=1872532 RepID=UPI0025EB870F|nr:LptF/LptG family permease [Anaerovibrio sp.]MCR5176175.1 LptF/LptG family permease [Anaerovibrio sp.]
MRIRILDRYIFIEVFKTFIFGICAFSAVFIGSGTLFRIAQYITEYGASLASVAKIFVLSLPGVIIWTFPMSMLLASLLTIGRMSGNSEITAIKSCGISFYRISMPAVILGALVSVFAIAFNEYVVPWSNEAYSNVLNYEIKGNLAPQSQEHIIIKEIKDGTIQRLVYARQYEAETNTMYGISMQAFENGSLSHVENAEYAEWHDNQWTMYSGIIYDVSKGETNHTMHFSSQILPINESPREIIREQKKPEELSMKELKAQIDIMKAQYVNTKKLETELYQRITIPMASLIFTLVAIPLGMQPNRNSSSRGFVISIIIIFIYYSLMTMAGAIAQSGAVDPMLAVWLPNIIGLFAGGWLMHRASR